MGRRREGHAGSEEGKLEKMLGDELMGRRNGPRQTKCFYCMSRSTALSKDSAIILSFYTHQ